MRWISPHAWSNQVTLPGKRKDKSYLFNHKALAKVFRVKLLEGLTNAARAQAAMRGLEVLVGRAGSVGGTEAVVKPT